MNLSLLLGCTLLLLAVCPFASAVTWVQVKMLGLPVCYTVQGIANAYQAVNPLVRVNVTCQIPNWYQDFSQDIRSATPTYDLHVIDGAWFGEAISNGALHDITDWREATLHYGDIFEQASVAFGEYPPHSQKYYGLPMTAEVFSLAYSKSAFARFNQSLPGTLEELVTLAEYFKARSEFVGGIAYVGSTSSRSRAVRTIIRTVGGSTWDSASYRIDGVLNSERNQVGVALAKRLFDASPNNGGDPSGLSGQLCSGQLPMVFATMSVMNYYSACTDVGYYPFPYSETFNSDDLMLGGSGIALLERSPVKDEALGFLSFLMSRSAQRMLARGGGFTVRKSVAADPLFAVDSNGRMVMNNIVFIQSASRGIAEPNLPNANQLSAIGETYVGKLLSNQLSIKDALDGWARDQQANMDAMFPCGPKCPIPYQRNDSLFTALFSVAIVVLAVFGVLFIALFVLREQPVLKAASMPFLWLTVVGASAMIVSFALEYQAAPSNGRCIGIQWTRLIGMAVLFGAIVTKTYRIAAIFGMKRIAKVSLTNAVLFRYFAAIVSIFVAFLCVWTAVEAPKADTLLTKSASGDTISYPTCVTGDFETYSTLLEVLLLLCASVLAFQVRNAPSGFHEAKFLAIGIYNWVVVTGICFLISRSVNDYDVLFVFDGIRVLLTAPVILSLLFIPKFVAVYDGADPSEYSDSSKIGGSPGASVATPRGKVTVKTETPRDHNRVNSMSSTVQPPRSGEMSSLQPTSERRGSLSKASASQLATDIVISSLESKVDGDTASAGKTQV